MPFTKFDGTNCGWPTSNVRSRRKISSIRMATSRRRGRSALPRHRTPRAVGLGVGRVGRYAHREFVLIEIGGGVTTDTIELCRELAEVQGKVSHRGSGGPVANKDHKSEEVGELLAGQ